MPRPGGGEAAATAQPPPSPPTPPMQRPARPPMPVRVNPRPRSGAALAEPGPAGPDPPIHPEPAALTRLEPPVPACGKLARPTRVQPAGPIPVEPEAPQTRGQMPYAGWRPPANHLAPPQLLPKPHPPQRPGRPDRSPGYRRRLGPRLPPAGRRAAVSPARDRLLRPPRAAPRSSRLPARRARVPARCRPHPRRRRRVGTPVLSARRCCAGSPGAEGARPRRRPRTLPPSNPDRPRRRPSSQHRFRPLAPRSPGQILPPGRLRRPRLNLHHASIHHQPQPRHGPGRPRIPSQVLRSDRNPNRRRHRLHRSRHARRRRLPRPRPGNQPRPPGRPRTVKHGRRSSRSRRFPRRAAPTGRPGPPPSRRPTPARPAGRPLRIAAHSVLPDPPVRPTPHQTCPLAHLPASRPRRKRHRPPPRRPRRRRGSRPPVRGAPRPPAARPVPRRRRPTWTSPPRSRVKRPPPALPLTRSPRQPATHRNGGRAGGSASAGCLRLRGRLRCPARPSQDRPRPGMRRGRALRPAGSNRRPSRGRRTHRPPRNAGPRPEPPQPAPLPATSPRRQRRGRGREAARSAPLATRPRSCWRRRRQILRSAGPR